MTASCFKELIIIILFPEAGAGLCELIKFLLRLVYSEPAIAFSDK